MKKKKPSAIGKIQLATSKNSTPYLKGKTAAIPVNLINKSFLGLIVIVFLIHIGYLYCKSQHWMNDDSFISFRYAENLVNGNGLVFNPGEKVEGYTNFLWTILIAFFMMIKIDPILSSFVLSLFSSIGIIFILYKLSQLPSFNSRVPLSLLPLLLLALNGCYAAWVLSGLETIFFTFLLILGIWSYLRDKNSFYTPVIFALLSMTRPDGVIFFACTLIHKIISEKKLNIKFLLIFILTYGSYFAWRYWYYGYFFPNTFYVKVGSNVSQYLRGFNYAMDFLKTHGGIFLLPILFFIVKRSSILFYLAGLIICFSLYITCVGGDYFAGFRFFIPLLPLFYLLLKEGIVFSYERILSLKFIKNHSIFKPITVLGLAVLVVIYLKAGISFSFTGPLCEAVMTYKMTTDGKIIGEYLKSKAKPNEVIAVNTAGTIPYYSKLKTIDMLGLNDLHIGHKKVATLGKWWPGHEKTDGKYILKKKPEYIILGYSSFTNPSLPSDIELCNDLDFLRNYEPLIAPVRLSYTPCFIYYRRLLKDEPNKEELLEELSKNIQIKYKNVEYARAIDMIKDCAGRLLNRGGLLFNEGNIDWAIVEFKKAIYLNPQLVDAHYWLGSAYLKNKEYKNAKVEFEKTLQIEPNHQGAQSGLLNLKAF